ncbi:MAG TPA: amidohydrolase family protein, partial [Pleomorphomonadaceae bacterium]|nr:amidohydrolase family protein [Pleomorphomonadaceae bacterium]
DDPRLPKAGTNIGNPRTGGAVEYLGTLAGHTCYLQHLSEGTDDTARGWFGRLQIDAATWAVTDALCAIHCTALRAEDLEVLAARGASMVWSPVSNYLRYGATTDMAAAKAAAVRVSLGSDWAPSGSKNLLGELKVAWLASRQMGDVFTPLELAEMVTVNPAQALGWDGLLGSIEPGKLADLVVVNGRTGDPYELLLQARESSITLVVIGGAPRVGQPRLMRRFWDDALGDAAWIDRIAIGRSTRYLYLEHDGDLLDGLPLSQAIHDLADAMARLPELAQRVDDAVGVGNAITAGGDVAFGGGMQVGDTALRVVPDFEQDDLAIAIAALGFAVAAQPYAFWVTEPIELDPITVVDDRRSLAALATSTNLPEFVKRGLPELYGETIPIPDSARFLESADRTIDPQLLATTADLRGLLATFGELTLDDREKIVDQAMVLLADNYVHLPLKRAMHAADPVQRLRLLGQRLNAMTPATMPPEIEFHIEVTEIFNALRDLHTGYRLPAPFGTKVAWLPFLIEEIHDRGDTRYVLTKWVADAWPDQRMRGAQLTHWNGMPIDTAIARNADRHAGSNPDARHARGLNSLTVRPLARGLPPDEDWVTIRWTAEPGEAHEHTQGWLVFEPGSAIGPADLVAESSAMGLDDHTDDVQQARKILYAPEVATAERKAAGQYLAAPIHDAASGLESHMPGVFRAMTVRRSQAGPHDPAYGYIRIFTFHVPESGPFVDEFVRLAGLLPGDGLIVDVRGNGGGLIYAAEELLQVLTPRRIEPEQAQFINSPTNLRICRNHRRSTSLPGLELQPWIDSMEQSVRTGATYSLGFPITPPTDANTRGQSYYGPVALITDALCYSATDMFAAGFQDHDIGTVIGVGDATGAGGANVWSHALLRRLMEPDNEDPGPSPYQALPRGADLRVAVRRTTRVGYNAGTVLEDLGVRPDLPYRMTRRDVMEGNRDLIDTAIVELARRRPHSIQIDSVQRHRDRPPSVTLRTRNIDRIDARADGRWLRTRDVRRDRVTLELDEVLGRQGGPLVHLEMLGYDGDRLAAALRETIDIG